MLLLFPKRKLAAVLFVMADLTAAQAAEWSVDGKLVQVIGYDDNVVMIRQPQQGSFEYLLTPTLNFAGRNAQWDIGGSASYGVHRYPDIPRLNYSPQHYSGFAEYRAERAQWRLNGSYDDTLNRNVAFEDTGDFASNSQRINWTIEPQFSYSLSKQETLTANAQYHQTTFSSGNFSNNEGYQSTVAWSRQKSERLKYGITSFFSHWRFSGFADGVADSYALSCNVTYQLTPTWDINTTAGGRFSDVRMNSPLFFNWGKSEQTFGFLGDISVNYQGKYWSTSGKIGRSITPSGLGTILEQTYASLSAQYQLDEHLKTGIRANYALSAAINQAQRMANDLADRENFNIEPHLDWTITSEWQAVLSYRYQQQDSFFRSDSNAWMLTLIYNWQGLRIAR